MDETFDSFSLHAHFEKKLQLQDIQWILSYAAAMFFFKDPSRAKSEMCFKLVFN